MAYDVMRTALPEVLLLQPKVFGDLRGFFFESFNARDFKQATGLARNFVQDNHSRSNKGVLRGMHYQIEHPQGKLVRVVHGEVFDVAVDLRRSSPNFGNGSASFCRARTSCNSGYQRDSRTDFWFSAKAPSFSTNRQTTGIPSMSAVFYGTILESALIGRFTRHQIWRRKTKWEGRSVTRTYSPDTEEE